MPVSKEPSPAKNPACIVPEKFALRHLKVLSPRSKNESMDGYKLPLIFRFTMLTFDIFPMMYMFLLTIILSLVKVLVRIEEATPAARSALKLPFLYPALEYSFA